MIKPDRNQPIRSLAAASNAGFVTREPLRAPPTDGEAGGEKPGQTEGSKTNGAATASLDENVSDVVKEAYNVVADNIEKTRDAADRFRKGDYKLGSVSGDLNAMLDRLYKLSLSFNTAAFNVFERLVVELSLARADRNRAVDDATRSPASGDYTGSSPAEGPGQMRLVVNFDGAASEGDRFEGKSPTTTLRRPAKGKGPDQIKAVARTQDGAQATDSISNVKFGVDLGVGVLAAMVTVERSATPGWHSALVFADGEVRPLGVLEVWLGERKSDTSGNATPEKPNPDAPEQKNQT